MELAKCESKRKSAFADFLKVRTPSAVFYMYSSSSIGKYARNSHVQFS